MVRSDGSLYLRPNMHIDQICVYICSQTRLCDFKTKKTCFKNAQVQWTLGGYIFHSNVICLVLEKLKEKEMESSRVKRCL